MKQGLLLFSFFFLATDFSHAAGMLMRVQQMKQMKAQQEQEEYLRAYQQYQQNQQPDNSTQEQQAPVQKTYQELVDERNQAIAKAIQSNNNQTTAVQASQGVESVESPQVTSSPAQQTPLPAANSTDVKQVVDLSEVWKKLDQKSTVWALLIDDQAKVLTVTEYINRFANQGAHINAPPSHYVQVIDELSKENPQMLQKPFGELLQMLAIVDYDFDNGMDRDLLVKKVLGEDGFEQNKKRFAEQQQQEQQQQQQPPQRQQ